MLPLQGVVVLTFTLSCLVLDPAKLIHLLLLFLRRNVCLSLMSPLPFLVVALLLLQVGLGPCGRF